jgi:hypothetical protein
MLEDYEALLPWNITPEKLGLPAPVRGV